MGESTAPVARCEDGTEIAFEWVYPDADQYEWARDRSHWPHPLTPMEAWILENGWPGADRAWNEAEMEPPMMFHRFQLVGPFQYVRMNPEAPERIAKLAPGYVAASRRFGSAADFWLRFCEPRIQRVCADLAASGDDVSLQSVAESASYAFHQTFTSLTSLFIPHLRLTTLLAEVVGDDATLMAYEVTQGGENASQAIDGELWALADIARRTPAIATLLRSAAPDDALAALRAEPQAAEFVGAFDELMARHGARSQGWEFTLPTWRERPAAPLGLIRAQLEPTATSLAELRERSAAARRDATTRALSLLPKKKHAEFNEIVAELDGYVAVREGRAYWQMVLVGELRSLLLRRGAALVRAGRIDRDDDMLFLLPGDIEPGVPHDLRGVVAARREDWNRSQKLTPPRVIGTPFTPAPAEPPTDELRGAPASRGEVVGTARVIADPDKDGSRLQPGDILVCVMTTPAWTPLFGIAGGIITETGGALSHPAITAREYGIPAVVAVPNATGAIRDGQRVTIDGGAGVVTLHR